MFYPFNQDPGTHGLTVILLMDFQSNIYDWLIKYVDLKQRVKKYFSIEQHALT